MIHCDRCGRPLPGGGQHLHTATPCTIDNLIGIYGYACARKVIAGAHRMKLPVYDVKGRRIQ